MQTHNGDFDTPYNHEDEPTHYEVLAVPQVPDIDAYDTDVRTVVPRHEILSLVEVPDTPRANVPGPAPDKYATYAEKAAWLRATYAPHAIKPVPFIGYNPSEHRGGKQLASKLEWVTVVTDGKLYLALNDAEFADLSEALTPDSLVVLGETFRSSDPQDTKLHEGYSLPELFGLDESGRLKS